MMLPPVPPDAVRAAGDALQPFGPLGAAFAHEDARRALEAAWPYLAADAIRWAADVAEARNVMAGINHTVTARREGNVVPWPAEVGPRGVTWLRDLADRVTPSCPPDDPA